VSSPKESLWVHQQLAKQREEIVPGGVSVLMSPEGWRGSPQTDEAGGMIPSPRWVGKQALKVAVAGNLLALIVTRCVSAGPPHQCLTRGDQGAPHPALEMGKQKRREKQQWVKTVRFLLWLMKQSRRLRAVSFSSFHFIPVPLPRQVPAKPVFLLSHLSFQTLALPPMPNQTV